MDAQIQWPVNYGVNAGSLGYVFTEIEHDVPYPLDYGIGFNQVLDDWLSEPVLMDSEFRAVRCAVHTIPSQFERLFVL